MHPVAKPENKVILDLIRHGEPEGGVMYRGSKDDPLSETGWAQMRLAIQKAKDDGQQWDKIITSPMQRCRAFSEWLGETENMAVEVVDDLREMHFGDLEGMKPDVAWAAYPELLKLLWSAPEKHSPPNGENFGEFVERISRALHYVIDTHDHQRLLVVVHGGVIRASLRHFMHMNGADTFRIDIPYAHMTRFKVFKNDGQPPEIALGFVNGYRGL